MFFPTYIGCGIMYSMYVFQKIFSNLDFFEKSIKNQFGEETNLNIVLGVLFINCLLAWPALAIQEINNRQDL